jgi:hypothetical protein
VIRSGAARPARATGGASATSPHASRTATTRRIEARESKPHTNAAPPRGHSRRRVVIVRRAILATVSGGMCQDDKRPAGQLRYRSRVSTRATVRGGGGRVPVSSTCPASSANFSAVRTSVTAWRIANSASAPEVPSIA